MKAFIYQNEEEKQVARIVAIIINASWLIYLIVSLTGILDRDWRLTAVSLTGCALQIIPFILVRRGHLRSGSLFIVLNALGMVTIIAMVGQGLRDTAIIAFPAIFVFASLALDRAFFRFSVGVALLAVLWLSLGETFGLFTPQPISNITSSLVDPLIVSILLLLSAAAIDLLAANMRANLEKARQEIAQRKQAEEAIRESEERFNLIVDATNDGLWDWNFKNNTSFFSPGYYHMLGYENGAFPMTSTSWETLIHPADREHALRKNNDCFEGRCEQFEVEYRMKMKNGEWLWIFARGKCVARDQYGRAIRMVGTHMDLSARKQVEEQLRYQSTHDVLTGIYNRTFFEEELTRLERGREFPVSLIMADVDGLKVINDTFGHDAGDKLLQNASNVLQSIFRGEDVLARIGGDEFAALLPNTDANTAIQIVTRIRERLAEFNSALPEHAVQLSIGVATAEKNNLIEAFKLADQSMYNDKYTRKSAADSTLDAPI